MNNLNERLKNAIRKSKYTQKEIAKILNTSQNTLTSYTTGKASITVEMLKNICELIDTSITWIIYGEEKELNREEINIINMYRQLNEKNKNKVEGRMEELLKEQNSDNDTNLSTLMNTEESNKKSS
jgi:transcriptional regulator with XRE-family HTH domain